MQPQQLPIEDNSNDILIDATMETNDKLADIAESSDVQVQGIMATNDELNELNRTADMILDQVVESKKQINLTINGKDVIEIIGPKGDKGDMPVKGKDYFTPAEIQDIISKVQKSIKVPKDGNDGYTPVKGKDYFTNDEIEQMINTVVSRIPTPQDGEDAVIDYEYIVKQVKKLIKIPKVKDGSPDTPEQVKEKLLKAGLKYTDLKDAPVFKPSSKTTSLKELDDVDLSQATISNGKYVIGGGGSEADTLATVTGRGATTATESTFSAGIITNQIKSNTSAGTAIKSNSGTAVAEFGAGGGGNWTFEDGVKLNAGTAERILATDANKNVQYLNTATYPSLTELSYVKGATSAIQTQINAKQATLVSGTNIKTINSTTLLGSGDIAITPNATHTGDVTGATALTIANDAVTNAKMANMATKTYKGRTSAGTGDPEDVSVATLKTDLSLNNVDNTSDATKNSATATLTNKRITPRVTSETSSATPTINTDNSDIHRITALAVNITSFTTNLSGTPTHGQKLIIEITGTAARTITWGTSFEASTIALPTTTVSTNMLMVGFSYNSATSKWRVLAVA